VTRTALRVIASGQLVRLREKQLDDAEMDFAWRTDPELAVFDAAPALSMSFRSFVTTLAEELESPSPTRRVFAIEEAESFLHIGNVMYYGYDTAVAEAELGITIGDRDYWGLGCGTEATRLMLAHLFGEMGLQRVYLHTLTWNSRAQQSFHKAGFRSVRAVHRMGHDFVLMEVRRVDHAERPGG
jgi:ribosomal-protein-alanine N-acetyltransferase